MAKKLHNTEMPHYVQIDESLCNGCVLCMKACPTQAIRVKDHDLAYIEGDCIDCGVCIKVCPRGAIKAAAMVRGSIDRSKAVLIISPVLYSQFGEGVSPDEVVLAFKKMGFLDVCEPWESLEMFNIATEIYVREHSNKSGVPRPLISAVCPVVVRLVADRFPSLLKNFPPILPPREIFAREVRKQTADRYGIAEDKIRLFHITPCSAKMISITQPLFIGHSYLDGVIGINDVYHGLLKELNEIRKVGKDRAQARLSGVGIGWGISGGEIAGMGRGRFMAVSGMQETIRYLHKLEMGLLDNIDYVEFRTCTEGCIGGPLTVSDTYQTKYTIYRFISKYGTERRIDYDQVKKLYEKGWFFADKEDLPLEKRQSTLSLSEAIDRQGRVEEVFQSLPGKDCAVCGSPDCRAFAEDVVDGKSDLDDCVYLRFYKS